MTLEHEPPGTEWCDVLVVGGGPAGLAAATELRRRGVAKVIVAEREPAFGGIARHSVHTGYGMRDLHRIMSGPDYAGRWTELARLSGVDLRPSTTVTAFDPVTVADAAAADVPQVPAARAELYSPAGSVVVLARAVVLATGARERPRSARLVPGDRPTGVYTTGAVQQLAVAGRFQGRRAVIVGAEHVSFSAVLTLAHVGCRTAAILTTEPRHQTYGVVASAVAGLRRIPVLTGTSVDRIVGGPDGRVTSVVVRTDDGERSIACDTVVFTGDWIADHELSRRSGLRMDPATKGPRADTALGLERPGWFAAGNLLHGAETADVCALDGRHVAASIVRWLGDARSGPDGPGARGRVSIGLDPPLRWVSPGEVLPGVRPPRNRFLLRVVDSPARSGYLHVTNAVIPDDPHVTKPAIPDDPHVTIRGVPIRHVEVLQGTRVLWRGRIRGRATPNRSCWIPAGWVDAVAALDHTDAGSAPITIRVVPRPGTSTPAGDAPSPPPPSPISVRRASPRGRGGTGRHARFRSWFRKE